MKYIDTPEALKTVCEAVSGSSWAAVDTEADSLHHYQEKLCLLQISAGLEDFVIDPLVPLDLGPLVKILSQKSLIFHGADFDIRILKRFYGFAPEEMFDTMIAAQLLGYEKQGLADLAEKHCGVVLSKSSQKADWSKRPLDDKLLSYAANDTHYLKSIREVMERELRSLGRIEWQRQSCQKLVKALSITREDQTKTKDEWQVKGSKELKGKALNVLKELWYWREEEARRRDRPSFKILHSETLVEIAGWAVINPGIDIGLWTQAPRNVKHEYREELNRAIKRAYDSPQVHFVSKTYSTKSQKPTAEAKNRFGALKQERDRLGAELKIQPSLLVTNAGIEILAGKAPKSIEEIKALDCLMPWQIELLSESILRIACR